ncbi:MAG: hypothetical protein FJY67_04485 [Calditrichaeota bacterium]|nr:hypothetical protein [Calditrichota bacterium]
MTISIRSQIAAGTCILLTTGFLEQLPAARVLVVEPRATAHSLDIPEADSAAATWVRVWLAALRDRSLGDINITVSSERGLQGSLQADLILLIDAVCLADEELAAIADHLDRGGSLLAVGAVGLRRKDGTWRNYDFLNRLTGGSAAVSARLTSSVVVLQLRSGTPLTAGLPPAYRLTLTLHDTAHFVTLTERIETAPEVRPVGALGAGYWDDRVYHPRPPSERERETALIYRELPNGSRLVWLGLNPLGIHYDGENYAEWEQLATNVLRYLLGGDAVEVAVWPGGRSGALVLEGVVGEAFAAVPLLIPLLKRHNLPATFHFDDRGGSRSQADALRQVREATYEVAVTGDGSEGSTLLGQPIENLTAEDLQREFNLADPVRKADALLADVQEMRALGGLYRLLIDPAEAATGAGRAMLERLFDALARDPTLWIAPAGEVARWLDRRENLPVVRPEGQDRLAYGVENRSAMSSGRFTLAVSPPAGIDPSTIRPDKLSHNCLYDIRGGRFLLEVPSLEPGAVFTATLEAGKAPPMTAKKKSLLLYSVQALLLLVGLFMLWVFYYLIFARRRTADIRIPDVPRASTGYEPVKEQDYSPIRQVATTDRASDYERLTQPAPIGWPPSSQVTPTEIGLTSPKAVPPSSINPAAPRFFLDGIDVLPRPEPTPELPMDASLPQREVTGADGEIEDVLPFEPGLTIYPPRRHPESFFPDLPQGPAPDSRRKVPSRTSLDLIRRERDAASGNSGDWE